MAEYRLDCMGEACPVPLLKTQRKLADLQVGEVLTVAIDHSCAVKNIPEWARKAGHNVELEEMGEGEWAILIEKTK